MICDVKTVYFLTMRQNNKVRESMICDVKTVLNIIVIYS